MGLFIHPIVPPRSRGGEEYVFGMFGTMRWSILRWEVCYGDKISPCIFGKDLYHHIIPYKPNTITPSSILSADRSYPFRSDRSNTDLHLAQFVCSRTQSPCSARCTYVTISRDPRLYAEGRDDVSQSVFGHQRYASIGSDCGQILGFDQLSDDR